MGAALGELAACGHHFFVLFTLEVEYPGFVEVLACLERTAVSSDQLDLAVDVGRSVATSRRWAGTLLSWVEVVEIVVRFR